MTAAEENTWQVISSSAAPRHPELTTLSARAQLSLSDVTIGEAEPVTDPELLMQIMEVREALEEASTEEDVSRIRDENRGELTWYSLKHSRGELKECDYSCDRANDQGALQHVQSKSGRQRTGQIAFDSTQVLPEHRRRMQRVESRQTCRAAALDVDLDRERNAFVVVISSSSLCGPLDVFSGVSQHPNS